MDFVKKLGLKKKERVKFKTEEIKKGIKNTEFSGTNSDKIEKFLAKMGPVVWDVLEKQGTLDDYKKSIGTAIFAATVGLDAEILTKFLILDGNLALNADSKISSYRQFDWKGAIEKAAHFCAKKYGDDYDKFFDDLKGN